MSVFKMLMGAAVIYGVYLFFNDDGSQTLNNSHSSVKDKNSILASYQNNSGTYAEMGINNSWPQMNDTDLISVADNITAKNYYLVVDGSGSMLRTGCSGGRSKMEVAKEALITFIKDIPSNANVGIYAFDNRGMGERLELGRHGMNEQIKIINSISPGDGTPLSNSISAGQDALANEAKKQLGYGEYHLVVVTDGEANRGYEPTQEVADLLKESPIVLHTIGFCINGGHSLNQSGFTLYKSASDLESLTQGLSDVLAEAPSFDITSFSEEGE